MTDQSPLFNDEGIWDELFHSDMSHKFWEEKAKKAKELLDQEK